MRGAKTRTKVVIILADHQYCLLRRGTRNSHNAIHRVKLEVMSEIRPIFTSNVLWTKPWAEVDRLLMNPSTGCKLSNQMDVDEGGKSGGKS